MKQKLWTQINKLQQENSNTGKTYVLFLPEGEINDLSLIFLNNLLLTKGYRTIYLGPNVSTEYLGTLSDLHKDLVFLSYFTVAPHTDDANSYISNFKKQICTPNNHELWVMGRILKEVAVPIDINIKVIQSFEDFEKLTA